MKMARYVLGQSIKGHSLEAVYLALTGRKAKIQQDALADVDGVRNPLDSQMAALGGYACDDTDQCYEIFTLLFPYMPDVEFDRSSWCVTMFVQPKLMLDPVKLDEVIAFEKEEKEKVLAKVGYDAKQIRSDKQFKEILVANGLVSPPEKLSPRTGKMTTAFSKSDKEFIDLLDDPNPAIKDLVACRLRVKTTIEESRAQRLKGVFQRMGGWLPVPLNYCGAMPTNRLSGGEKINLQNLGRKSKLRDAIVAPDGYVVVAGDMSNIELRITMAIGKELAKLDALRRGEDLYCVFASKVFNRQVTKANDPLERQIGKVGELSLGYGSGSDTYRQMLFDQTQQTVWIDKQLAEATVQLYRDDKPHLMGVWQGYKNYLANAANGYDTPNWTGAPLEFLHDGILLPDGFKIKYPNMRSREQRNKWGSLSTQYIYDRFSKDNPRGEEYIWYGQVLENCSQALARAVLAYIQDVITYQTRLLPCLQVHDELVFCIPVDQARWFKDYLEQTMHMSIPWWPDLPLAGEAAFAKAYGDAK